MKKILLLFFALTVTMFAQTYNPYDIEGWDAPYAFTGETLAKPPWTNSVGFYELGIFTLGTNPGGWLNRNFWRVDSLMESLVVYTDTNYIVITNDTLTLTPYLLAAIDTNYNPDYFDLKPVDPDDAPHKEGRIYYDSLHNSFNAYIDEPDVTMNLGEELWIRVYNNTGVTIENGMPVYPTGTFGGSGTVAPADATADATSNVIGLATHSIEDGTYGRITRFGSIGDVNTTLLVGGATFFLKVGTGITTDEPEAPANSIPLGGVTAVGDSGSVFAIIERFNNHNGIAHVGFEDESALITIGVQGTLYPITNATDGLFIYNTDVGHDITLSGDTVYVDEAGVYAFNFAVSFEGVNGAIYEFQVEQNGVLVPNAAAYRKTTSTDVGSCSFNFMAKADAGDYFVPVVANIAASTNVTMIAGTISIRQVR